MKQRNASHMLACFIAALLICSTASYGAYSKPPVDIPQTWRSDTKGTGAVHTAWWEQFNDPTLLGLIQEALKNNHDIRIATARIREYHGLSGIVQSQLWPHLSATALSSRGKVPAENTAHLSDVQAAASWELDVFGHVRNPASAARAELKGAEEFRSAVVLSLVSAVANAYLALRALDQKLSISQETEAARQEALSIITLRFSKGIGTQVDVDQASIELNQAQMYVLDLQKSIAKQENALCALLGRNPSPITRGQNIDQLQFPHIPVGIPSDILAQRPDIRQAEDTLAASHALVKAARANYFPTISLTGAGGSRSSELEQLFSSNTDEWNFAGQISMPIFTAGRTRSQVKETKARHEQMRVQYQKTVQNAFREVNDALVDYESFSKRIVILKQAVDSLEEYAKLSRSRYDNGATSYLEVLDAERNLYSGQIAYVETQMAIFVSLVNLYKVMGGGWLDTAQEIAGNS